MKRLIAGFAAAFATALVVVASASGNSLMVDPRHCEGVLQNTNGTLSSPDRARVAIPSSHMLSARWTRHRGPSSGRLKIICESLPCPCLKPGAGATPPAPPPPPQEGTSCGVERRSVKTLTDQGASRVSFVAKPTTIAALRLLAAPDVGRNSPRLPGEFSTYRVKVRLRSMKIEDDSDIHLVIADPTSTTRTMIAELPNAACVRTAGATSRRKMAAARAALLRSCGPARTGRFRLLTGTATITGVAFFDVIHGQRGVAPNGIELHPVLSFNATSKCTSR